MLNLSDPNPNHSLSREELLLRLEEAEETLRAIRSGEVDALVVSGAQGQVFTLKDATLPYQILIEEMNEGALTLSPEGVIPYCNARFAEMLGLPMPGILGHLCCTS
jgi:PAS domain-containing protein